MDSPTVADSGKLQVKSESKTSMTPCRRIGLSRPSTGSIKKLLQTRTYSTLSTTPKNEEVPPLRPENSDLNHDHSSKDCNRLKRSFKGTDCIGSDKYVTPTKVQRSLTISIPNLSFNSSPLLGKVKMCRDSKKNSGVVIKTYKHVNRRILSEAYSTPYKTVVSEKVDCSHLISSETNSPTTDPQSTTESDNTENKSMNITPEMIKELVLSIREKKKKLDQLQVRETYAKKHNVKEVEIQTSKWKSAGQEALRYAISLARQAGVSVTLQQLMSQHGFPPHLMDYNADNDEFD